MTNKYSAYLIGKVKTKALSLFILCCISSYFVGMSYYPLLEKGNESVFYLIVASISVATIWEMIHINKLLKTLTN